MARSCCQINVGNFENFVSKVKEEPETAKFTFRTVTEWEGGAATRTVARSFSIQADEPEGLGGADSGPNPVELLLAGVATCFAAGLTTRAARQGIDFKHLEVVAEGDLDLHGYLGLNPDVRPGFTGIRYVVHVDSDASREQIEQLIAETHQHSPMVETVTNGVPVEPRIEFTGSLAS